MRSGVRGCEEVADRCSFFIYGYYVLYALAQCLAGYLSLRAPRLCPCRTFVAARRIERFPLTRLEGFRRSSMPRSPSRGDAAVIALAAGGETSVASSARFTRDARRSSTRMISRTSSSPCRAKYSDGVQSVGAPEYSPLPAGSTSFKRCRSLDGTASSRWHAQGNAGDIAALLVDEDEVVRWATVQTLQELGEHAKEHVVVIAAILANERDASMRCAAFGALGTLGEHAKEHVGAIAARTEDDFFDCEAGGSVGAGGFGRAREGARRGHRRTAGEEEGYVRVAAVKKFRV